MSLARVAEHSPGCFHFEGTIHQYFDTCCNRNDENFNTFRKQDIKLFHNTNDNVKFVLIECSDEWCNKTIPLPKCPYCGIEWSSKETLSLLWHRMVTKRSIG